MERTLAIGNEFVSFDEFDTVRQKFEIENFVNLVNADSKTLKASNGISAQEVDDLKYGFLLLKCKYYGKPKDFIRQRETQSYKCDCTFSVRVVAVRNLAGRLILKVVKMNSVHANHVPSKEAFMSLPRQRCQTLDDVNSFVQTTANVNANPRLVQYEINHKIDKKSGKVTLKDIYNRRSKLLKINENNTEPVDDLRALVEEMEKIDGAVVRIVTENDSCEGIYFQEPEMKEVFAEYPEMIFCDATYCVNDRNMPLQVLMCVDGEGETHIIALFIIRSENMNVMHQMLDIFKQENPNYNKIEVIMVDKHISNVTVFPQDFPHAKIHLCIFHVYEIFKREITPAKRGITKQVKKDALKILHRMIYCDTEEMYLDLYQQLTDIGSDQLLQYFNNEWHVENIRKMWAGYIVNKVSHFENRTNNRTESFNQKLKKVLTAQAPLKRFFSNVIVVMETMKDERDHRTITKSEKSSTKKIEEELFITQYRKTLTSFGFSKLKPETDAVPNVQFTQTSDINALTFITENNVIVTTLVKCNCDFQSVMKLPCRHILKFRKDGGLDPFDLSLCHPRWMKTTLSQIERADIVHSSTEVINLPAPRALSNNQKYRVINAVFQNISDFMKIMPQAEFDTYLQEFEMCRDLIANRTFFNGKMLYQIYISL